MVRPASPSRLPTDPVRLHLVEVRRGLLRLHKTLIDAERLVFERRRGPLSNGQFLQALLQDPFFAWLRPFSSLIAQIDEALAAAEGVPAHDARIFLDRVRVLIHAPEPEARYQEVRERDPDVLFAHLELTRRLAAAGESAAS